MELFCRGHRGDPRGRRGRRKRICFAFVGAHFPRSPFRLARAPSSHIQDFLERVRDYITDICCLACKHNLKLEVAFINAALARKIMEGLASPLYPDLTVQSVTLTDAALSQFSILYDSAPLLHNFY